jgi:hypothetical protein
VSAGASGSGAQLAQQVQAQMLRAIHETIAPKMASGQLSFKDLGTGNTAAIVPEIFARSGLAQAGIAVDRLVMRFGIDGREPPPLPSAAPKAVAAQAAVPQQVNLRVGGLNVHASSAGGIDAAGLKNQLIARAKSKLLWWAFGVGIVLLVVVVLGGYGFYVYRSTMSEAPAAAAKAEGKESHPAKK